MNANQTVDLSKLPDDLPRPVDDGAARHLVGMRLPHISLPSTRGGVVDVGSFQGHVTLFCYPRTGVPGVPLLDGWDQIPGARGCTPQACSFRDRYQELKGLGTEVFGISTQTTDYQQEMATRLHLPFAVLSDSQLQFQKALDLPVFEAAGMVLLKRLTLIAKDGVVVAVHYPIFPPDSDSPWVVELLRGSGGCKL